MDRKEY